MHNNLNNKLNNLTPKINFSLCDMDYSWTSLQRPPWGQKKVAIVERLKQESMYGLSAQKNGRNVERWSLVEVRLYHKK